MSQKPEHESWIAYWRLAWRERPGTGFLSIPRVLLSLVPPAIQYLYFANIRSFLGHFRYFARIQQVRETWVLCLTGVAAYAALYFLEVVWNLLVMAPVMLDEVRRLQVKTRAVEIHCLKSELQEALDHAKVRIGFQLKSETLRPQPDPSEGLPQMDPSDRAHISLDVWNDGPAHVEVTALRMVSDSGPEAHKIKLDAVLTPALPPHSFDITDELMARLARSPAHSGTEPEGADREATRHLVQVAVEYEAGGVRGETEAKCYEIELEPAGSLQRLARV